MVVHAVARVNVDVCVSVRCVCSCRSSGGEIRVKAERRIGIIMEWWSPCSGTWSVGNWEVESRID